MSNLLRAFLREQLIKCRQEQFVCADQAGKYIEFSNVVGLSSDYFRANSTDKKQRQLLPGAEATSIRAQNTANPAKIAQIVKVKSFNLFLK